MLIDSMNYLTHKILIWLLTGKGVLGSHLKARSSGLNNVKFIVRVNNPYLFN